MYLNITFTPILNPFVPCAPFLCLLKTGGRERVIGNKRVTGWQRVLLNTTLVCNFFTSSKTSDKCCVTDEKVFYEIETKFTDSNWKLSCAICYMRLLKMEHNTCSISIFTSLKLYFLGFIPSQNIQTYPFNLQLHTRLQ